MFKSLPILTPTATNPPLLCWLSFWVPILISIPSPPEPPRKEELLLTWHTWWRWWMLPPRANSSGSTYSPTATSNCLWSNSVRFLTPLLLVWTLLLLLSPPFIRLLKKVLETSMIWTLFVQLMKTRMMIMMLDITLDWFSLKTCNGLYLLSKSMNLELRD